MIDYNLVLNELKTELLSCLDYLRYSYEKITDNKINISSKEAEDLESLDALVSRFARATDIFIAKYLRTYCLKDDPGYKGSLVDTIYCAEKMGLIQSAKSWIEIRELRNKIAHEYATQDLQNIFIQVLAQTPTVLEIKNKLP